MAGTKRHEPVPERRWRTTVHMPTQRPTRARADLDEPLRCGAPEVEEVPVRRHRRAALLDVVAHAEPAEIKVF